VSCGHKTSPHRNLRAHDIRPASKRADLFNEAIRLRDRTAEIKNDVDAIDRVLGTLGYTGDLDREMPRQKRHVVLVRASYPDPF
jgi:hypothetical protein